MPKPHIPYWARHYENKGGIGGALTVSKGDVFDTRLKIDPSAFHCRQPLPLRTFEKQTSE